MTFPNPSELVSFVLQSITAILLSVLVVQNISHRRRKEVQSQHQLLSILEIHRVIAAQEEAMECIWNILHEGLRDLEDVEGKARGLERDLVGFWEIVGDLREKVEGLRELADEKERRESFDGDGLRRGRYGGRRAGEMRF